LPCDGDIDYLKISKLLSNRPLSDVSFAVREGARLAARAGHEKINQDFLLMALEETPERNVKTESDRKIGFI